MTPPDGSCATSAPACSECRRPFAPLRGNQKTCGSAACQRSRNVRLTRLARGLPETRPTEPRPCAVCGAPFVPSGARNIICSEPCAGRRHYQKHRERPRYVERNRERCRAWAVRTGRTRATGSQTWLAGAPAFAPRLPGALIPVTISPMPRELSSMSGTTQLHGMLSAIFGDMGFPHEQVPTFALVATSRGWSVYAASDELAAAVERWRVARRCGRHQVEVVFGEAVHVPAPVVRGRGRRVLRVTSTSPTLVRRTGWTDGSKTKRASIYHGRPNTENVRSALLRVGERLGIDRAHLLRTLRVEVAATQATSVAVTARELGSMRGWSGDVVVTTNAVGEWLLRAAETVGLGGRVGFGFGRIGVTTESEPPPRMRVPLRRGRRAR